MATPRVYAKECLKCGKPNPLKRQYCSNVCLLEVRRQRKVKPKIYIKKIRKKPKVPLKKCKNCGDLSNFVFCTKECKQDSLNKNRLRRPCRLCDNMFRPTGKASRICNKCRKERRGYL